MSARYSETELWQRLSRYEIGPGGAPLSFTDRLARENRWSGSYAERVVGEYRRFCFLAMTTGREVTPSDAVDQAWHLHLTYSRDYWQRFCPEVLRGDLHHGPTGGTSDDRTRYYEQYADTLKLYEDIFGEAPPGDIWANAQRRFQVDPRAFRVNPADAMVLTKWQAGIAAIAVAVPCLVLGWLLSGAQ